MLHLDCVPMSKDEIKQLEFDDIKTLDLLCDPTHALDALNDRDELLKVLLACKKLYNSIDNTCFVNIIHVMYNCMKF